MSTAYVSARNAMSSPNIRASSWESAWHPIQATRLA